MVHSSRIVEFVRSLGSLIPFGSFGSLIPFGSLESFRSLGDVGIV